MKIEQLVEVLKNGRNNYIQMHNSPDPDAIASAFGLQKLLETYQLKTQICYKGEIEKFNTKRMIELLDIEIVNINNIPDMNELDYIVLVDSQKGNSNITDFPGDEVAVIDHHPIFENIEYRYKDIRVGIGATSSIITEYFIKNNIQIPKKVSTALLYGIKMDTLDLSRGVSELDIDMFYALYKKADLDLLGKIQLNTLEFGDLIAFSNTIKNIRVFGKVGISDTGANCPDSLLGSVSDFVLSLKEVEFAVVYSRKNNGIKFSVRSEMDDKDAGKIISDVLKGYGNGGGHKTMAGGFISGEVLLSPENHIEKIIEERILSYF